MNYLAWLTSTARMRGRRALPLAREGVVHFEVAGRAVHRDGHAVGWQQRVVVDDRDASRGEAGAVAEQRGTGLRPGEVAGVARAQGCGGDGFAGAGDSQPVLAKDGVEPALAQVLRLDDAGERRREVGGLDDQGPAGR